MYLYCRMYRKQVKTGYQLTFKSLIFIAIIWQRVLTVGESEVVLPRPVFNIDPYYFDIGPEECVQINVTGCVCGLVALLLLYILFCY